MAIELGSAPDSWGVWFPDDPKQTPWQRFLDEITEVGYTWTELGPYGYMPTDKTELAKELDQRGLKITGSFLMMHFEDADAWPEIEKSLHHIATHIAAFDARYLVLIDETYSNVITNEPLRDKELTEEQWKVFTDTCQRVAQIAKDQYGLTSVFHPHAETHIEFEHQIERLLDSTDPDLIKLCLDTGHHAYRGGDPIAFLKKYHARTPYLHLKSVDAKLRDQVNNGEIPFGKAVEMDMFVEPSRGVVDFIELRDLLKEIDFDGFGIVEQDMYPCPFDKPLPIAKRTKTYLNEIGLG